MGTLEINRWSADYVRKEIASLRLESEKNSSPTEERINKDDEVLVPPSPREIILSEKDLIVEKEEPIKEIVENENEAPAIENAYDAKAEIQKRLEGYNKYCEGRRRSLIGVSFITGYISRYGVSTGDVHFWTCFLPKGKIFYIKTGGLNEPFNFS